MVGTGAALSGLGLTSLGEKASASGRLHLEKLEPFPKGLYEAVNFSLIDAIQGRRSRRFALGAEIPDGPLKYKSRLEPESLSELEQMLLLTSMSGNTGWSNLIPYNRHYLPSIPNYAGAAGGRTFPSAAGFHTSNLFFTDDTGAYFLSTKDMPGSDATNGSTGTELNEYLKLHQSRVTKISDGRLNIPAKPEHMEMHNEWCANVPGSTFIVPVADLAQHSLLSLCYLVQNGACVFDDLNSRAIPGLEKFKHLVDIDNPFPISYLDQMSLTEVTAEMSSSCYSGALVLQAMGLGGWMYSGVNPLSLLGASGDPEVPGLGFRYDVNEKWVIPNVTGLEGVFEGHCPPHFPTMKAAVESVVKRKFGDEGPFNPATPGPYKDNANIRSSAAIHNEEFIDCVATMAQYIFDTFGKYPATIPSMYAMIYLQAHQLDTGFYDTHLSQGGYLKTHKDYAKNWGKTRRTA